MQKEQEAPIIDPRTLTSTSSSSEASPTANPTAPTVTSSLTPMPTSTPSSSVTATEVASSRAPVVSSVNPTPGQDTPQKTDDGLKMPTWMMALFATVGVGACVYVVLSIAKRKPCARTSVAESRPSQQEEPVAEEQQVVVNPMLFFNQRQLQSRVSQLETELAERQSVQTSREPAENSRSGSISSLDSASSVCP